MKFKIPEGNIIALDTETTGLSWRHGDQWYCLGLCNPEGESAVISFLVNPKTRKVEYNPYTLQMLSKWAANPELTIVAHNAAFDIGFLQSTGIVFNGTTICTMNLIRLNSSSESLKLKPFCEKYFGLKNEDEEDLKQKTREMRRKGKKEGWKIYQSEKSNETETLAPDYWMAGPKYFEPYCQMDAARAMLIYKHFNSKIDKKLLETEIKTWSILRKIENRGIRIYKDKVLENKLSLKKKLHAYLQQLYKKHGWLNPNSPQQLSKLFYQTLNLPQKFLTEKNNPSTDNNALRAMNHPTANLLLNIRACEKTIQFMDQYLRYMVRHDNGDWYIHPRFHQAIASTGRESCSDPNLQQVASGERDTGVEVRVEARSVFGPSRNYVMRSYDWKNIEAYIPAFKSEDPVLTKILASGGDVHENTSKSLTQTVGMPISRYDAKRVFFGLQYGIGINKLARTLGIEKDMAAHIIYGFKNSYPGLWEWMDNLKHFIRRHGFIETAYGRKIQVPRDQEYKGVNYYVQGTAAGILRSAKIKIAMGFRKWDAFMVLPIHDEVLIEYGIAEKSERVDEILIEAMQDNPELKMPVKIPVSVSAIGKTWAEKTKIGVY